MKNKKFLATLALAVALFTATPAYAGSDPSHHGDYPTISCYGTARGVKYSLPGIIGIGGNHPQITEETMAWARGNECFYAVRDAAREDTGDFTLDVSEVHDVSAKAGNPVP